MCSTARSAQRSNAKRSAAQHPALTSSCCSGAGRPPFTIACTAGLTPRPSHFDMRAAGTEHSNGQGGSRWAGRREMHRRCGKQAAGTHNAKVPTSENRAQQGTLPYPPTSITLGRHAADEASRHAADAQQRHGRHSALEQLVALQAWMAQAWFQTSTKSGIHRNSTEAAAWTPLGPSAASLHCTEEAWCWYNAC